MITLNRKDYYNKVYGGWLGKNIGGTLGGPVEGRRELMNWTFYPKLFDGPAPNDDLDLQLVWLHALEQYGARLTARELGQEWLEHVYFPMDEYGYAVTNLRRGLVAPVCGYFNNPFTDCMGSPIRSEIWAMVAPGAPGVAAYYAYQDAIVDHAGGEGVYGEMFYAAVESAAFFESNPNKLLDIGLTFIPEECRTSKAIRDLRKWHSEGKDWVTARNLIMKHHGRENFTDAPQNIAYTILGLLYGENFGDALLKAVNCGFDADCTGATLGSILGIIGGMDSIPPKWSEPVGDRIALSPPVKGFPVPENLEELTQRTLKVGKEVMAVWNIPIEISLDHKTYVPQKAMTEKGQVIGDYDPRWLWNYSFNTDRHVLPQGSIQRLGLEVIIDYGADGPSIGKNMEKSIVFKITNDSKGTWEGTLELIVPEGFSGPESKVFKLTPGESITWDPAVKSNEVMKPNYDFVLNIHREHRESHWSTSSINFSMVASTHWQVRGPEGETKNLISPGNRIEFERVLNPIEKGTYYAKTTLINPKARTILLTCAAANSIKVSVNGKVVIEDRNITELMPAYHRAVASKQAEIELAAGEFLVEIEAEKGEEPLDVYLLPTAIWRVRMEDTLYYTDVLMA